MNSGYRPHRSRSDQQQGFVIVSYPKTGRVHSGLTKLTRIFRKSPFVLVRLLPLLTRAALTTTARTLTLYRTYSDKSQWHALEDFAASAVLSATKI